MKRRGFIKTALASLAALPLFPRIGAGKAVAAPKEGLVSSIPSGGADQVAVWNPDGKLGYAVPPDFDSDVLDKVFPTNESFSGDGGFVVNEEFRELLERMLELTDEELLSVLNDCHEAKP